MKVRNHESQSLEDFCIVLHILGSRYAHIADLAILDLVTLILIMIFHPLSGFIADVYYMKVHGILKYSILCGRQY